MVIVYKQNNSISNKSPDKSRKNIIGNIYIFTKISGRCYNFNLLFLHIKIGNKMILIF